MFNIIRSQIFIIFFTKIIFRIYISAIWNRITDKEIRKKVGIDEFDFYASISVENWVLGIHAILRDKRFSTIETLSLASVYINQFENVRAVQVSKKSWGKQHRVYHQNGFQSIQYHVADMGVERKLYAINNFIEA